MRDEHLRRMEAEKGGTDSARNRIVLERLVQLEAEIESMKGELESVKRQRRADAIAIRSFETRLARLRLDRQLRALPRWIAGRLRVGRPALRSLKEPRSPLNLLVVAPKYPSKKTPYGGQPVERRLSWYVRAGFNPLVLVPSNGQRRAEIRDGVEVVRTELGELRELVAQRGRAQILIHHPTPDVWEEVRPLVGELPIILWIHGFEARDWRDADFESSPEELSDKATRLDPINFARRKALAEAFADDRVVKVFVSEFAREVASKFTGVTPTNSRVIHNVIDTSIFEYARRNMDARFRILAVKSFAARTYATDLVCRTIMELSNRPMFDALEFEVRGDGKYFQEDTASLSDFPNVTIRQGVVSSASEMASLMHENGVLLAPTRLDTQGITMGEGMATGMAIVTNRIAAIPEFIDDDSGVLVDPEDVVGLADAIERIGHDPGLFSSLSENAARRVRVQCAPPVTVQQEIELIRHHE